MYENKIKENTYNITEKIAEKNDAYSIEEKTFNKKNNGNNKTANIQKTTQKTHNIDFEEGLKQGKKEKNIELAKKMIYKGIELETIMEITKLTGLELIKIK